MPQQPRLHLGRHQRHAQQRIAEQVDLTDRQVIRRPPIRINQAQVILTQRRTASHRRHTNIR
jgi:hypothetical protein